MKKGLLIIAGLIGFSFGVQAQILTFDFAGLAGNEATANSNSNNANLTTSAISRGAGLTAATNADRFNATGWSLTSIANAVSGNDYMEFTITPNSGYQFNVSSIVINLQRSGTGPSAVALKSSLDGYTANLDAEKAIVDNTTTQTFTFTFTQSNSSSPVTYRFYMYAEAGTGSGGIGDGTGNDLVVNGSVSASTPSVNLSADLNAGTEAGATVVTLTATASSAVSGAQTVDVAVSGTGITAGDYSLGASSITIADGQTTGTTTFTVVDDAAIEGSETATVTISNPSSGLVLGSTLSQNIAITDNDANNVNLSADVNSGTEAGTTVVTLTATASTAVTGDQTVDVAVTGTGITAGDYTLGSTTITILNGATTGTVTFTIVDDAAIEGAETATITISNPSSGIALGSTLSQNVTITDNDFATTVQFSSASATVAEGVGTTTLTLSIANPSASTATTVDVALTGGTGSAADINSYTTQTMTFPANTSGDQTVTLTVTDDALVEGSQTLIFTLQNVAGGNSASLGSQTTHTLTVTDNDFNSVYLNSANVAATENFDGMGTAGTTFLQGWTSTDAGMLVSDGSSNTGSIYNVGTASASDRAFGSLAGTVVPVFGASLINNTGSTVTTLEFSGVMEQWRAGDNAVVETLPFEYSTNATSLTTGTWTAFTSMDLVEKLTGTTTAAAVDGNNAANRTAISGTLTGLSVANGSEIWIRWTDTNNTGADGLYAIDDFSVTPNPKPKVTLSATANSGTEASGTVVTLTATASFAVTGSQTVDVAVSGTGITGTDYSLSSSSITIADGAMTGTATFTILDDSDVEGAETATVTISNPSSGVALGATVSQNVAITDNDFATTVQFALASSSVAEDGGTIDLSLSIANPSGSTATTVEVALTSGSPADINSYSTQTVTFPAGSSSNQTVTITVTDDASMEGNENLTFTLQNPSGGNVAALGAQTTHTLTITDNDNASISLSGSANEGTENGSVVTVNLTNDTFVDPLTPANWTVTNLPAGVSVGSIDRINATQVTITLSGNRTDDYDANRSPVVSVSHEELTVTASGTTSANSGFNFIATDDAESISIASDGSITEGSESGEVLTVTVTGGTLVSTLTPANWVITNAPDGVTFGSPVRVSATQATITISSNRTTDYDANDTDLQISVNQAEIDDYSGGNLVASGVTFTAVVEAVPAGFFTEYVEGTSNNKAIEIFNNSGSAIDFTAGSYKVEVYANGSATATGTISLTGTLAANDVYVIVNSSASAGLKAYADLQSATLNFNGDDAVALKSGTETLDVIGQIGSDPGTEWVASGVSTLDKTIRRKATVTMGDAVGSDAFNPSVEWDVFAVDTFTDLGLPPSQANPTSGNYANVTISGPTTLTGNLTVSGTLTISGANLNTGSNSINLGSTGSISGETTTNYILGTVNYSPTLSGSSPLNIGGLGLTINPTGQNLGVTTIVRKTGATYSVHGQGIRRQWTISPATQPDGAVTVTITWPSGDDNGVNLNNLYVFRSENNGTSWLLHDGPFVTASNPRSITFTTSTFSDWTVGDGDSPLPVELVSWTATPGNGVVKLAWETASELNNAGFEIYRSTKKDSDFRLIASYQTNESLRPRGQQSGKYALNDNQVINTRTYYYKLADVSIDGKRTEHKVLSAVPTDGKPQQPGWEAPIEFKIAQLYPNPFNPSATLVFSLPHDGLVSVRLFNVIGQEVAVLKNEVMKKDAEHTLTIKGDGLPSGIYLVVVESAGQRLTKRLTLLK